MKTKILLTSLSFSLFSIQVIGQHVAFSFQDAKAKNISIEHLDSVYKSAVNVSDSSKAVFKTEFEQNLFGDVYVKLLQDLGKYLHANNFYWEKKTKCINRVYFNSDGTIDYFLYNLKPASVKPEDLPSQEQQIQFSKLLSAFIKDYKISMTANTKFSQCGPATYLPK